VLCPHGAHRATAHRVHFFTAGPLKVPDRRETIRLAAENKNPGSSFAGRPASTSTRFSGMQSEVAGSALRQRRAELRRLLDALLPWPVEPGVGIEPTTSSL